MFFTRTWLADVGTDSLDLLRTVGSWLGVPATLCLLALYALYKGWFVTGRSYSAVVSELRQVRRELRERDAAYLELIRQQHESSDRQTLVMEKLAELAGVADRRHP